MGIIIGLAVLVALVIACRIVRHRAEKKAGKLEGFGYLKAGVYEDGTVRKPWGQTVLGKAAGSQAEIVSTVHHGIGKSDVVVRITFADGASHTVVEKKTKAHGLITREIDRYNRRVVEAA